MKVLLALLLLLAGCKKPESNNPHQRALVPLEQPVVYARYDTLPALLRTKPGACANAYGFRAPDRYRLNTFMDLCGPVGQKTPWLLQDGFKSIQWEQDLNEGEKLQLELIGADGIPLPSTAQISKTGSRMIAQLKPVDNLPKDVVLIITATLFDAAGKKLSTWSVPFKITGG